MNRNLVNFQAEANEKKDRIGNDNISISNIRVNEKGIFFNIKIENIEEEHKDLCIPSSFYISQKNNFSASNIEKNKDSISMIFLKYIILLPLTILSLGIIFSAIFKYLPMIQNLLNFDYLY